MADKFNLNLSTSTLIYINNKGSYVNTIIPLITSTIHNSNNLYVLDQNDIIIKNFGIRSNIIYITNLDHKIPPNSTLIYMCHTSLTKKMEWDLIDFVHKNPNVKIIMPTVREPDGHIYRIFYQLVLIFISSISTYRFMKYINYAGYNFSSLEKKICKSRYSQIKKNTFCVATYNLIKPSRFITEVKKQTCTVIRTHYENNFITNTPTDLDNLNLLNNCIGDNLPDKNIYNNLTTIEI